MTAEGLSDYQRIVLDAITRAADRRLPCPSNDTLVGLAGCHKTTLRDLLIRLERRGIIRLEYGAKGRRITVVETGRRTDWRKAGAWVQHNTVADRVSPRPDQFVDRDPCPRCGVRRDIGCGHSARALRVGYAGHGGRA